METQSEPEKEPKPRRRWGRRRAIKSKKEEEQPEEEQPEYPVERLGRPHPGLDFVLACNWLGHDDFSATLATCTTWRFPEIEPVEPETRKLERLDEAAGQSEKARLQSERSMERLDELKALMDQNRAKKTDNTHNGIGWCWAELLLHRVNSEVRGLEPKDPGHWTWGKCAHCETRTNRIEH